MPDLHPIVRAGARAVDDCYGPGEHESLRLAELIAPAVLLQAAEMWDILAARSGRPVATARGERWTGSPEQVEADRVSAWLRGLAEEVGGAHVLDAGAGYLRVVGTALWMVLGDARRLLEGVNATHKGALSGDLRRMRNELDSATAAVEQAPEVLGGGTDG